MKNTILFLFLASIIFACSQTKSFETKNGTVVNYIKKGEGNIINDSLISLIHIRCVTEDGKVIMESEPDNPRPLKINTKTLSEQGELFEILSLLRTGDSVGFDLVAEELYAKTFRAPLPDSIEKDSKVKFQVAVIDQLTETGYYEKAQKKAEEHESKQLVIDTQLLEEYFKENNIATNSTESGLRYIITQQGTGKKPEIGQTVAVNYTGKLLDNTHFDTSVESVAKEQGIGQPGRTYEPFTFALGQGRVIKGWDEGIALLNVGTKATFYIPSSLGYGSRGSGPIITPNAILVFDVELVSIQNENSQ